MGLFQTNPKGAEWIAIETPFLLLALAAVALRLWARKLKRRTLEFNDYAILVAIVRQFRQEEGHSSVVDHVKFFIICAYVNIIIGIKLRCVLEGLKC